MSRGPYVRAAADRGPGRVEHYPPGTYPPGVLTACTREGCPSLLAASYSTSAEEQARQCELSGWTRDEQGPVCPCDHKDRWQLSLGARLAILAGLWVFGTVAGVALGLSGYANVWTASCTAVVLLCSTWLLFRRVR